jgi:hypothetical protein
MFPFVFLVLVYHALHHICQMYVWTNPEKEIILATAITLCKTTALSLTHVWTDIIAGSGCTTVTCVQPQPDAGKQQRCHTAEILNNYTC